MNTKNKKFLTDLQNKQNKLDELKKVLPELTACDDLINRHMKGLYTLFQHKLRWQIKKDWKEGQHLTLYNNGKITKLVATTNISGLCLAKEYKLNYIREFDADTLILYEISYNEFGLFKWGEKDNPNARTIITENNDHIEIHGRLKEQLWQFLGNSNKIDYPTEYQKGKTVITFDDKFNNLKRNSLTALALKVCRLKGGKNGTGVAKARVESNESRIVRNLEVIVEFHNGNDKMEKMNIKKAWNLVVKNCGYDKTYHAFRKMVLSKQKDIYFLEKSEKYCIYLSLACQKLTSQVNKYIDINNDLNFDLNESILLTCEVNSEEQVPKGNNKKLALPPVANARNKKLVIEYEEFCTRIPEENKFTFKEYCELRNAS